MSDNDRQPTPEEVEKTRAETEKIRAETAAAQAKNDAELAKMAAETAKLQVETAMTEDTKEANAINLAQMKRQEEAALAVDLFHQRYFFGSDVNARTVQDCIDKLSYWNRTQPGCDIDIVFHSPGGSVFDGLVLFDYIQELKRAGHFIRTSTLGMAASMAGILLQAGSERVMGKESWMLIHEISTVALGSTTQIEDEVEFVKRIQKRVIDIFLGRAADALAKRNAEEGTSHKVMSRNEFIKHWQRKDWWLDSDEAYKLGFVDRIDRPVAVDQKNTN